MLLIRQELKLLVLGSHPWPAPRLPESLLTYFLSILSKYK